MDDFKKLCDKLRPKIVWREKRRVVHWTDIMLAIIEIEKEKKDGNTN